MRAGGINYNDLATRLAGSQASAVAPKLQQVREQFPNISDSDFEDRMGALAGFCGPANNAAAQGCVKGQLGAVLRGRNSASTNLYNDLVAANGSGGVGDLPAFWGEAVPGVINPEYFSLGVHLNLNQDFYRDGSDGGSQYKNQRGFGGFGLRDFLGGPGFDLQLGLRLLKPFENQPENMRFRAYFNLKFDRKSAIPVREGDQFDVAGDGQGSIKVTPEMANALSENSKGLFWDFQLTANINAEWFSKSQTFGGWWYAGPGLGLGALARWGFNEGKLATGSYEHKSDNAGALEGGALLGCANFAAGYMHTNGRFLNLTLGGCLPLHDTSIEEGDGLKINRTMGNGALSLHGSF